jgi:sulfite reductase beta subunit-like hemoprotein
MEMQSENESRTSGARAAAERDAHGQVTAEPAKAPTLESRRFSEAADIDEFVAMVERFENGEITPDQFRAYRLVRGIYGQRQDDVHMIRVKIPGGVLVAEQLEALADVARSTIRGVGHVTTRQNIQYHFVPLHDVEERTRRLDQVGLTTRGACGNSVRNVTGCAKAGICPGEPFDTTPFSDAITRFFLRRPLAEHLPRKFKIALSGCSNDCAAGAINDIGLIAHRAADGSRRFRVLAGGGLSFMPMNAFLLHESYPAERICEVAEALLRLFDRTGNRRNKAKARMKWVVKSLGQAEFVRLYNEELASVVAGGEMKPLDVPEDREARGSWILPPFANPKLAKFARRNIAPTAHVGRVFITLKLPVGDITADQFDGLASLIRKHGDHTVRLSIDQNLLLRDVAVNDLPEVYRELEALGLVDPEAGTSADVLSCPGADSCKLAITTSKDLAKLLTEELRERPVDDVSIKMSGCPNSCGQHHIATIGLHGGVRKIGDRAAPQYLIMVGGGIGPDGATFGRMVGKIPARRAKEAIERLLALAQREKNANESIEAWFRRVDEKYLKSTVADLGTAECATEEDFVDVGSTAPFQVVEMEGECAA